MLVIFPSYASSPEKFEFSADSYRTNFETKITEAEGKVRLVFEGKSIQADHLILNARDSTIVAEGNIEVQHGTLKAQCQKATFNLKTGLGNFQNAILRIGNSLFLEGREIERYETQRYRISYGKVSTCMDCPQAWSVVGSDIDIEVEGYAEIHHALFEIKDTPVAYFPLLLLPVKSKRQSGFLIPELAHYPDVGFSFRQPYFFALSPSSDLTFEAQQMTRGGQRAIFEYRHLFSDRSFVFGKAAFGENGVIPGVPDHRFGYRIEQRWQIHPEWVQRFRGELASDSRYSQNFYTDFESSLLPSLQNELSLLRQDRSSVFTLKTQFHRNNIPRDSEKISSDSTSNRGPIHQLPSVSYEWPAIPLSKSLLWTPRIEHSQWTRRGSPIDPQTQWIRTGNRSSMKNLLNAPTDFGKIYWNPSLSSRYDFYQFPGISEKYASRSELIQGHETYLEFWKIYSTNLWPEGRIRHSLRPFAKYSQTLHEKKSLHPFFSQTGSPKFDLFDPESDVPQIQLGTITEEQKLRKHQILSFGISNRLIGNANGAYPAFSEIFFFSIERDYNFILKNFGRIRSTLTLNWKPISIHSQISYDPKQGDRDQQNSLEFTKNHFSFKISQLLSRSQSDSKSERESYVGQLELKNLGPWSASTTQEYDSISSRVTARTYGLNYLSPSRCWTVGFQVEQIPGLPEKYSWRPLFNILYQEQIKESRL